MTAAEIEQAVIAAGFAVYECEEYRDGVKLIVSKSETFTLTRQFYFGTSYQKVTAPVWFKCVKFAWNTPASDIAASLQQAWREDN